MQTTADLGWLVERAARLGDSGRCLIGITGAPGSGKSTVSAALVSQLAPQAVVVPMDGFHLTDDELRRLGRAERKGAPDTFDVAGYLTLLRRFRAESSSTVYAPEFDRSREQSVAGAIAVRPEHRVVITEGNYLLLQDGGAAADGMRGTAAQSAGPAARPASGPAPGWAAVRDLLDEVWYVEAPEHLRVERLVARHAAHGKELGAARAWATGPDQVNADLVAGTRARADLVVQLP